MRLIDADDLKEVFAILSNKGSEYGKVFWDQAINIVDDLHTVEAIPVEWILNSIKDMKPYYAVWEQRMGLIREWVDEQC